MGELDLLDQLENVVALEEMVPVVSLANQENKVLEVRLADQEKVAPVENLDKQVEMEHLEHKEKEVHLDRQDLLVPRDNR